MSSSGLASLSAELRAIDTAMSRIDHSIGRFLAGLPGTQIPSATNLLHYLILRRFDLRRAQKRLAELGLSSLGRAESHVRDGLTSVRRALSLLAASEWTPPADPLLTLEHGEVLLARHTEALFGPAPEGRGVRIMVTMPSEAADDYGFVHDLVLAGMDCMRVNCAHDGPAEWSRMIGHLRRAAREIGRCCSVSMDLAGPKLRTADILPGPAVQKVKPHRDAWGRLSSPAFVAIADVAHARGAFPGAEAVILIDRPVPDEAGAGNRLTLVDAREHTLLMRVVARHGDVLIASLERTAYVVPGAEIRIQTASGWYAARVADTPRQDQVVLLEVGDRLVLTSEQGTGHPATRDGHGRVIVPAHIGVTLPQIFADIQPGERIWFDDGRIGGIIRHVDGDRATVEITQARPGGDRLQAGKGINLPDSSLRLAPLTGKDLQDLEFVVQHADLVAYSFVRRAVDVQQLQERLAALGGGHLGIILKIETRQAFEELPRLLLACMRTGRYGVMIARGDLAVECGYERMAEVQEEILWIAEAAHAPVIWATQVLETLAKTGVPSRAEVTDAAMSERAECVMLNKGPFIREAVRTLAGILTRMQSHQTKKRAMLRPLNVAQSVLDEVLALGIDVANEAG